MVKVEQARRSDAEPHLSMKSDVDEAESVKSEVVKKEDDDKGDDIDTKDFKDLIKKTVELDGQWKHVDVKLIPQITMDDDIQILNSDIPIQTNQYDILQEDDIKPTAFTAVNMKQPFRGSTSPNVDGASKFMEKSIFGEGNFSRITRRPLPDESSDKAFQHKYGHSVVGGKMMKEMEFLTVIFPKSKSWPEVWQKFRQARFESSIKYIETFT